MGRSVWADLFGHIQLTYHAVDGSVDGVSVSFQSDAQNKLHPNVVLHTSPLKIETLIHHPRALQFDALEKIEQIIAMGHVFQTKKQLEKTCLIFNSFHFIELLADEYDFAKTHPTIQKQFARFNKQMSLATVAEIVEKMMSEMSIDGVSVHFPNRKHSANDVAFYVLGYLHQFDPDAIFHHELRCVLRENACPTTEQDQLFLSKLNSFLESPKTCYEKTNALVKETAPTSKIISFYVNYIAALIRQYQRRIVQTAITSTRENSLNRITPLTIEAKKHYLNNNFQAASN